MEVHNSPDNRIFTIGHSNQSIDQFLSLLSKYQIDVVVDTRSSPYSKFSPQFNQDNLKLSVKEARRKYLFMGHELGGRPRQSIFYDEDGYVLYWKIAESEPFQEGIHRLRNGIARFTVAVLCSEENPIHCHRRLLIGRVLKQFGVQILHIRSNGLLQSEDQLEQLDSGYTKQMSFLSEAKEDVPWRSIQSVSQKRMLVNSLKP